jgi:hypothetical protein
MKLFGTMSAAAPGYKILRYTRKLLALLIDFSAYIQIQLAMEDFDEYKSDALTVFNYIKNILI